MYLVTASLTTGLVTSHSPARMGLVLATQMVAMAVSGLMTGSVAARLGPRRVLLVGDAARGLLVASVPVLHWLGALRFGVVLAVAFGIGVFFTPHHSARLTLLPILAGDDETALGRANSVLQAVNRSSLLLGPPLAGVLISVMGAASVLWIDVASFALSFALVFAFVRVDRPAAAEPPGFCVGLRTTLGEPVLRPWTIALTFFEAVWQFIVAAVPLMVYLYFEGDARMAGLLMAAIGVGAVTGNLVSLRLAARAERHRLILAGSAAQTILFWCMIATAQPWSFGLALLATAFALGIVEGPLTAAQVSHIPYAVRAQTIGASFTLTLLGAAAGTLAAPPALDHLHRHLAFLAPALAHTLGVIVLALALHRLTSTARPAATPSPAPDTP